MSVTQFITNNPVTCIELAAFVLSISQEDNLMQNSRMHTRWLEVARRFQALSQTGLAYSKDPYDRERYEEIQESSCRVDGNGYRTAG